LADSRTVSETGPFSLVADVSPYNGQNAIFELQTSSSFIPQEAQEGADGRQLSLMLEGVKFESD